MNLLIIGAAGMLGRRLGEQLAKEGALGGKEIMRLALSDVVAPTVPTAWKGAASADVVDLSAPGVAARHSFRIFSANRSTEAPRFFRSRTLFATGLPAH